MGVERDECEIVGRMMRDKRAGFSFIIVCKTHGGRPVVECNREARKELARLRAALESQTPLCELKRGDLLSVEINGVKVPVKDLEEMPTPIHRYPFPDPRRVDVIAAPFDGTIFLVPKKPSGK